jgi:hypothetical protein
VLSGSELWLLRLMADRGLALLDASALLVVIEERGELRVAAASGQGSVRVRIVPVEGSALGAVYGAGESLSLERPRGPEAAWLHELGLEARAALIEPLSMEGHGGGLVIALRSDGVFRGPDRDALKAFATSVAQRLAAERSVEIERLRYGMEARERERTRWARELHDESIQGMGALRMKLANARDLDDPKVLSETIDTVLEGLGQEIEGLRHLITELRPAALDDLGLAAALQALARRAQAIDGLEVTTEIHLGSESGPRAGEHDLQGGPGGAHERQPPRAGDESRGEHLRAGRHRARLGHRRRARAARRREPGPTRRRPRGRIRHGRDARAGRAGGRRARPRARPWGRHDGEPAGTARPPPSGRDGRRRRLERLKAQRSGGLRTAVARYSIKPTRRA